MPPICPSKKKFKEILMAQKRSFDKYIKLFLYATAVILVNAAGIHLFFRMDLTQNRAYSLSEASKAVVSTLSEPLTIHVFFTKNLPAPYNQTEQYLHDLLEEYAIHADTFFNYRFYNVNPEDEGLDRKARENQNLADDYGIHPVQIQMIEKDEVKFKKAYMGLVLIHGDLVERIPTVMSTDGLEYQLTTAIQKLNNKISAFLNLSQNVDITLYLSSSLKSVAPLMGLDRLNDLPRDLEATVKKLNGTMYGKLSFHHIDPTKDADFKEKAGGYQLMTLKWPDLPNENVAAGEGLIGVVLVHEERAIEVPLLRVLRIPLIGTRYELADMSQLEDTINSGIERLIDINEDLGYLADHDTLDIGTSDLGGREPSSQMTAFSQLVSQTYSIKPVFLEKEPISEGLKCLVIAGPKAPFTDYELYQIDQALMRGTNLALFLDAFKEVEPPERQTMQFQEPSRFEPLNTGLNELLNHYGIQMRQSFVMDENCYRQRVPRQFGGGERPIYYAPLIQPEFMNNHLDFMKNIKGLVCLKVSPLELDENRLAENGIKAVRLFSTSDKSWELSDRITLNPMLIRPPPAEEQTSFSVAYLMEGEFSSFFAGKPVPVREADSPEPADRGSAESENTSDRKRTPDRSDLSKIASETAFREKGAPGKIILVSSSEMLTDNILDPEGKGPNVTFILNILDVLNDRNDIAVMRSKDLQFNPLYTTGPLAKTLAKTINIAGVPFAVILFGCIVFLKRRGRKKRIQMLFQ
jgi:ABC-2 type transport system permease protein